MNLKSSSAYYLSQSFWRFLRKILNKKIWTYFYTLYQKFLFPSLVERLSDTKLELKENLNYPRYKKEVNKGSDEKFSKFLIKSSKPEGAYRDYLDNLFIKLKHKTFTILEIGVSSGASLRAMEKYFSSAYLWGVDIDKETFFKTERINHSGWIDQLKIETMRKFNSNTNVKFDLIIDDGWHHPQSQINSLVAFLPYLSERGVYIVEDIVNNHYKKNYSLIIKILEKKNFNCKYLVFKNNNSEISNTLGYLIVSRK